MPVRDDMYKVATKGAIFGTGPDGQPWAEWKSTHDIYCLTYPSDLAMFESVIITTYRDTHHLIPDPRHFKTVLPVLIMDARATGPLSSVGEADVLARGTMVAEDEIDLEIGETATVVEVLNRLGGHDDLFTSGTTLVRLLHTHDGMRLDPLPPSKSTEFGDWAHKAGMRFFKRSRSKMPVRRYMPPRVARLVLANGVWPAVRKVAGVSTVPVVRQDGTLASDLGYDDATGLILDVDADLRLLDVPEQPTADDVIGATVTILTLLNSFTFDANRDADASRANAIGLLFTPHLRRTFPGMLAPMHAVDAPTRGSGKTLLAGDLPGAFGGGGRSLLTYTGNEGETRKRLTSEMVSGGTGVLCYDNVAPGTTFASPFLSAVLTSTTYSDRLLGGNSQLVVPQSRTFTVTGNRLRLGPDEAARAVLIALKPETSRPDLRTFAFRLDDHREVARLRPEVVSALLTCLLAWIQAGCPGPAEPTVMRQFTEWGTKVGGLLEFIGIKGHLRNAEALIADDDTAIRMGALWELLWEEFGTTAWTGAEAAEAISKHPEMDPELPTWLTPSIAREGDGLTSRSKHALAIRLGYGCRGHVGGYYAGLRVERAGTAHKKVTRWALVEEYEGAHDESR